MANWVHCAATSARIAYAAAAAAVAASLPPTATNHAVDTVARLCVCVCVCVCGRADRVSHVLRVT